MKRLSKTGFNESASTSQRNGGVPTDLPKKHHRQHLVKRIEIFDGDENVIGDKMLLRYKRDKKSGMSYVNETNKWYVHEIHKYFLNAGANIIRTATTRAFFPVMNKYDPQLTEEEYNELITNAVDIATNAVEEHNENVYFSRQYAMVVGSCGHFEPTTVMTRDEIKNEYRRLINALSDAGIITFCLQDIQSTEDADMLVELLKELPKFKRCAFMMFKPSEECFSGKGCDFIETAIRCYNKIPLTAVGVNGLYPADTYTWLEKFGKKQNLQKKIPLVVCSNKPLWRRKWEPINLPNKLIIPKVQWAKLGIYYIGGYKGVNGKDIRRIRNQLI